MTVESSLTFFLAVFIFGITPGPGVFAILSRALVSGARSCVLLALGMVISDILYLIAACFGLAALATHWEGAFSVVRWLGAAYLLYLGWKMWTAPRQLNGAPTSLRASAALLSFMQGFLISASNPKVILFYIAFLPTFIDLSLLTGRDIALVSLLTLVSLMLGLNLIAFFAGRSRRFFESERGARVLNRSAGSIMIGAGVFLLVRT
jgi:threonine/homoserine/homoserine lactone efflux protein